MLYLRSGNLGLCTGDLGAGGLHSSAGLPRQATTHCWRPTGATARRHLTDEHFKHMAEVSGTNIRELESFCERCAGEAGDREREGGEPLTFDDIDAIASQYFDTSAKKINVQTVQSVIEEQYGVTHEEPHRPASQRQYR